MRAFVKAAYISPALFLTAVALPLHVFVPRLYTDDVGISADLVGYVLIATALFDAISDPLMGAITDRSNTRFGRRRPYIALGSLVLAGSFIMLLSPGALAEGPGGALYLCAAFFLVYVGWTVVVVPYEALGIDITSSYDERTRLMGLRETTALVGLGCAIIGPVVLVEAGFATDLRQALSWFSLAFGPPLILTCWWCARSVQEPSRTPRARAARGAVLKALLRNRPYLILLGSFTLSTVAGSLPSALMLFFAEHVLGAEQPGLFLVLWVGAAIVSAPLWIVLAEKTEKRTAYIAAIILIGGSHGAMFFLSEGQLTAYAILAVLAGVPFAGLLLLPAAMQADAIDLGVQMSGNSDEGFYVGAWNLARKVPAAVASGAALSVLGWSGYAAGEAQSDEVLLTLRVMYSLVPTVVFALALVIALAYPIDRARHADIQAELGR